MTQAEYLEAEFRRYFPDLHRITVDCREDETIHVTIGEGAVGSPADYSTYEFVMDIESDDDWYAFEERIRGYTLTIPLQPETELPYWRSDEFTDQDRDTMLELKMDEIRDCLKDMAAAQLDVESRVDIIMLLDPDIEVTVELLKAIRNGYACMEDYESGEFGHHETSATFMKRFKLVENNELTERGEAYLENFGD